MNNFPPLNGLAAVQNNATKADQLGQLLTQFANATMQRLDLIQQQLDQLAEMHWQGDNYNEWNPPHDATPLTKQQLDAALKQGWTIPPFGDGDLQWQLEPVIAYDEDRSFIRLAYNRNGQAIVRLDHPLTTVSQQIKLQNLLTALQEATQND